MRKINVVQTNNLEKRKKEKLNIRIEDPKTENHKTKCARKISRIPEHKYPLLTQPILFYLAEKLLKNDRNFDLVLIFQPTVKPAYTFCFVCSF